MSRLTNNELTEITRRVLTENGFVPEMSSDLLDAADSTTETGSLPANSSVRDLRRLLWSSIDNESSRDLDQVEYAEKLAGGDIKLLIGIADVDRFVPKDSTIDKFAAQNTLSVYAANHVFPMLPERLSTDLTSLNEGEDRFAVVIEMIVRADGDVQTSDVYPAIIHNYAKLSYEEIGEWLDENADAPEAFSKIKGLEAQIRLQLEAAKRLYRLRKRNGALEFETIESSPVVQSGAITDLKGEGRENSARRIIENFMIATNVETAQFLEERNFLSLRRVVKIPARWNRIVEIARSFNENLPENPDSVALAEFLERRRQADPVHFPDLSLSIIKLLGAGEYVVQKPFEDAGGHFGLAVQDYAHSTAPNRRYADLIVQRLLKAAITGKESPYTAEVLTSIAAHCNERESRARKVERQIRKTIAASVMSSRVGEIFDAIVTGVNQNGTFARTLRPPVDGRIVAGEDNLEVGDKVRVKLIETDAEKGFIDFVCRH
jgi:exoribonuclease-2